jgi:hypothetical protein
MHSCSAAPPRRHGNSRRFAEGMFGEMDHGGVANIRRGAHAMTRVGHSLAPWRGRDDTHAAGICAALKQHRIHLRQDTLSAVNVAEYSAAPGSASSCQWSERDSGCPSGNGRNRCSAKVVRVVRRRSLAGAEKRLATILAQARQRRPRGGRPNLQGASDAGPWRRLRWHRGRCPKASMRRRS